AGTREIVSAAWQMARLPDLFAFAQLHGLKIGTIADLIAYRRRTERQVERILERPFDSAYGGRPPPVTSPATKAYRPRPERQVERILERPFDSAYGGRFRMIIYRNIIDQTEHVGLTR